MVDVRKRVEEISQAVFRGANARKLFNLILEHSGWDAAVVDREGSKYLKEALASLEIARALILGDEE